MIGETCGYKDNRESAEDKIQSLGNTSTGGASSVINNSDNTSTSDTTMFHMIWKDMQLSMCSHATMKQLSQFYISFSGNTSLDHKAFTQHIFSYFCHHSSTKEIFIGSVVSLLVITNVQLWVYVLI